MENDQREEEEKMLREVMQLSKLEDAKTKGNLDTKQIKRANVEKENAFVFEEKRVENKVKDLAPVYKGGKKGGGIPSA